MIARIVSGITIILIVLVYFLYNFFFSVNFPYQDDFLLIQFIEVVSQGQLGLAGLVTELFRTFNDHKAVIPRFIALVEYVTTGQLNFRFYILLVLVNVIYIFGFVFLQFRKMRLPLYFFLPAPFLFFHPLFHEISGWALNGMQHTYLTAFTVTAIMLVSSRIKGGFYWAMLCCFLATFTHGNGILSFSAIVFYFLCLKDFRKALMTGFFMGVCLVIYLTGYESGQAMKLPQNALVFASSFFGFIGSEMSLWSYPQLLSACWGLIITVFMGWLVAKVVMTYFGKPAVLKPGTLELLTLFAFIVVTSLVIAIFRSWTGSTIASRFQIYAALSTVLFYLLLVYYVESFKRKYALIAITALSVLYWGYSHYKMTGLVAAKKTTYLADVYNWSTNRNMFSVEKSLVSNANFYLKPAYQKGFFKLPKPLTSKKDLDSMFLVNPVAEMDYKIYVEDWITELPVRDGIKTVKKYFITSQDEPLAKRLLADRFLVLRNTEKGQLYLMCANPKIEGRRKVFTGGSYYKNGFNALLRTDDLGAGTYELALLDVEYDGSRTFYKLNKQLKVSDADLFLD